MFYLPPSQFRLYHCHCERPTGAWQSQHLAKFACHCEEDVSPTSQSSRTPPSLRLAIAPCTQSRKTRSSFARTSVPLRGGTKLIFPDGGSGTKCRWGTVCLNKQSYPNPNPPPFGEGSNVGCVLVQHVTILQYSKDICLRLLQVLLLRHGILQELYHLCFYCLQRMDFAGLMLRCRLSKLLPYSAGRFRLRQ